MRLAWWLTAGGIATLAAVATFAGISAGSDPVFLWQVAFAVAGAVAGLYVWARQPGGAMGRWLAAYAAGNLIVLAVAAPAAIDLMLVAVLEVIPGLLFTATLLAYPTGHIRGRSAPTFLVLLTCYNVAQSVAVSLIPMTCYSSDLAPPADGAACPQAWTTTDASYAEFVSTTAFVVTPWVDVIVWTPWLVWLLVGRARVISRRARRIAVPFYVAAGVWLARDLWGNVATLLQRPYQEWVGIVAVIISLGVPLVLAYGAAEGMRRRARTADLVVDLGNGAETIRGALVRAIGDPTLRLALRDPTGPGWVDDLGRPTEPVEDDGRVVTVVAGGNLAVIHDSDLLPERRVIEIAGSAAYLALVNERLLIEREAQVAEIQRSRARITAAADEERRRIERDLHDGAQQRLVGVGVALRLAGSRNSIDAAGDLIRTAAEELQAAIRDLQDLARGIYPAVLTDGGLRPALAGLVRRCPVPIESSVEVSRLPAPLEVTVYFVVAECLTNIVKHSGASSGTLAVTLDGGNVTAIVSDNGRGGAVPGPNSGLRGLADRIAAMGGQLSIDSTPGTGTRIEVTVPCE